MNSGTEESTLCPFCISVHGAASCFPNAEVPFTIENYAYRDSFGRETVTWVRTFKVRQERRFDATMIFSEQRGRIVYLGSHQHLAVDIDLTVDANGGLRLRSGAQRFTKVGSDSASPCSSQELPTFVNGSMTSPGSTAF